MPWTVADVPRFTRRARTDAQKVRWVRIANSALARCRADGGSVQDCEASAIRQANSVIANNSEDPMPHLLTNILSFDASLVREEQFQGRAYLVAPVVMVVEGVLNQSMIRGDVIRATHWDGIPVTLSHPMVRNQPVSANSPMIRQDYQVGEVFNVRFDQAGLRGNQRVTRAVAEAWIDVAQAQALGEDGALLLDRLHSGDRMEVSVGFFPGDVDDSPGIFQGARFDYSVQHLQADHLAILLHEQGACNWRDGCGFPRVHKDESMNTDQERGIVKYVMEAMAKAFGVAAKEVTPDELETAHADNCGCNTTPCSCTLETQQSRLGNRLRELRDAQDLTTADLAQAAGVAPGTMSSILSGEIMRPPDERLRGLARLLGVSFESLRRLLPPENNATASDLHRALYGAFAREQGVDVSDVIIEDVTEQNEVIYRRGEHTKRRTFQMDDGGVVMLNDDEIDVQRDTRYVPVTAAAADDSPVINTEEEGTSMPNAEKIQEILTHPKTMWQVDQQGVLETMSDEQLDAILVTCEAAPEPAASTQQADTTETPKTVSELLAMADPRDREFLQQATSRHKRTVELLVNTLAERECGFTKERLATFSIEELEGLEQKTRPSDYSLNHPFYGSESDALAVNANEEWLPKD